ncbi:MAG: alpha/beta hydrolase [Cyanobacteria bacterium P01_D01_bin.105]
MASANKSLPDLFNPLGLNPLVSAGGWAAFSMGAAYAGICVTLYCVQRKLMFRPLPALLRTPAELGLPYEDVWIPAQDGGKLHGWWLPNPSGVQAGEQTSKQTKVLLFCHGNYGNISYNTERLRFLHRLGFSILAFDYRGYGQSVSADNASGSEKPASEKTQPRPTEVPPPTEQSVYADAEAAWHYLTQQRGIEPNQITTLGHSMGGAIAIYLATRPFAKDMARLIVTSSFTTMEDVVRAKPIYALFPIRQLLTEQFDSLSRVADLPMPVLYVHGDQDFDVPMPMSKRLYEASPERKQIWIAPGADHNNICLELSDRYQEVIQAFCNTYPTPSESETVRVSTAA